MAAGPARYPPQFSRAAGRAGQRARREGSKGKCRSDEANTAGPVAPIASEANVGCYRSSHFSSHSIFLVAVRNAAVAAAHSWIVRDATNNATAPNAKQAFQAWSWAAPAQSAANVNVSATAAAEQRGQERIRNN